MAVDTPTGATLTFTGLTYTITSMSQDGIERAAADTTHLSTAASSGKTFIPSAVYDPGEITAETNYDETITLPITGAVSTATISFPNGASFQASAFLTSSSISTNDVDSLMTLSVTLKATGSWTQNSTAAPTTAAPTTL